jgi:hypothetical protein
MASCDKNSNRSLVPVGEQGRLRKHVEAALFMGHPAAKIMKVASDNKVDLVVIEPCYGILDSFCMSGH